MASITFYDSSVPNEIRWLFMFADKIYNSQFQILPDFVRVSARFGRRNVDISSLSAVREALRGIKVKPRVLNGFHLDNLFKFTLEDSTAYDPLTTYRLNDLTKTWGPVKLHPYANWMSLVSAYVSKMITINELNMGLVDYKGEPGVVVTFENGSSALFCPSRVVSPFAPDPDLEIYPAYPVIRRDYTFEMLPVITTLGQVTGELDSRYHTAVILLVLATTAPDWQAYVYNWKVYWRTESALYSLPDKIHPAPEGSLPSVSSVREDAGDLYVFPSMDPIVKITPALAYDALETMRLLNLKPVEDEVAQRLRRLADRAISILNGMTA